MKKYILKYCWTQLNLKNTFLNGQCFNWQQSSPHTFTGVLFNRFLSLRRLDPTSVEVQVYPDLQDIEQKLNIYFYSDLSLKNMYKEWSQREERFKQLAKKLPGTRIVKQDPWQCTISFICSSNNNISRITGLLRSLKRKFGKKIVEKEINGEIIPFHEFPSLKDLLPATQDDLKSMGFGYRAQFIIDSVKTIRLNGGQSWLRSLQLSPYQTAKQKLMTLKGIGRKVADCICLFGLGCHESVPIDTHMFQIAKKLGYVSEAEVKKSMSETMYRKIAESYRKVYGEYAGWAQQIIFTGDLASFQDIMKNGQNKEEIIEQTASKTITQAPTKLKPKRSR